MSKIEPFNPEQCFAWLKEKRFEETETYLNQYDGGDSSIYWNLLGESLRGQSKINRAYVAYTKAIECPDASGACFYNLGRLEGECVSFHRASDIRKRKYGTDESEIIYSCFGEQDIIKRLVEELSPMNFAVDIGASDGLTFSNTHALFLNGWNGVCFEPHPDNFKELARSVTKMENKIKLCNEYITPDNVLCFFELLRVPIDFGLLSLDIDSYDYYVLDKILEKYTPVIICTEINENHIPPLRFAYGYQEMEKEPPLFLIGQSISMVNDLFQQRGYTMIHLEYNNVFAVKNEWVTKLKSFQPQTDIEAYTKGFLYRPDTQIKLNWSFSNIQFFMSISEPERIDVLVEEIKKYEERTKRELKYVLR